jgi:hypothetical protein
MRSLPDRPCHGETRQRAPVPVHVAVAVKDHVNVKAHVNVYEFSATQLPKSRLALGLSLLSAGCGYYNASLLSSAGDASVQGDGAQLNARHDQPSARRPRMGTCMLGMVAAG